MNTTNATFQEIGDALRGAHSICVLSHVRPDGDAYGSQLALALSLKHAGKSVTVWNEDAMNDRYRFLPGSDLVGSGAENPVEFDVVVVLDTATYERAGKPLQSVAPGALWINIDHHISNGRYGDLVHIDGHAPATGEIIFEFLTNQEFPFTYGVADNLYAAISTDTGSFQYPSTTARTYEIAAELVRKGVDVGDLARKLYESFPMRRIELLRETLTCLRITSDGRCASAALSQEIIRETGALPDDTEGLIDQIRAIEGVLIAAFFEELDGGKVRVSLRSKDPRINVCEICKNFNGGGHALAAGARPSGTLAEVEKNVLEAIHVALARVD